MHVSVCVMVKVMLMVGEGEGEVKECEGESVPTSYNKRVQRHSILLIGQPLTSFEGVSQSENISVRVSQL